MSEIKVTFAELAVAQHNVAGTAQRIAARLDELKRFLAPLAATWEGQAATDYQARQRQWDTAAADLASVLARIGVALGTANDSYQQVEQANARRWQ
ncbi:WXG100 family type VII secretion target [Pseudonocardia acidicola]|uniref:ESAT-6-like protein n=1 Tax=Pseudonocardia acidicola TaxID=2724939 RepID=A0ABX1SH61_9PSEU|nr:WXG100 family type VII secretion target [Pseudonocardia acidicola]NMI00411.1 WXG100 family type VII secretion target [Pseudonocardia acidicola]